MRKTHGGTEDEESSRRSQDGKSDNLSAPESCKIPQKYHVPIDKTQALPSKLLGRNTSRLRYRANLTQDKLAELAMIDRRYVQRIERGSANPGIKVLSRIKNALACTWEELLD